MSVGVLLLIGLEVVLAGACWLLAGRQLDRALLCLLVVTAPLEVYRTPVLGVNVSLFRLSLAIAMAVFATGAVRASDRRFGRDRILLVYLALLGVMVLSLAVRSENTSLGARLISQIGIGLVTATIVAHLATKTPARVVAGFWIAGSVLPLLAGVWQGLAQDLGAQPDLPFLDLLPVASGLDITRETIYFGNEVRMRGTFGDPNHFAIYTLFAFGMVGGLLHHYRKRRNLPMGLTMAFVAFAAAGALISTYSRSAWVAAVIALLLAAPFLHRPIRNAGARALIPLLAAVGVCIAIAVPTAPAITDRLASDTKSNVMSNESHTRTMRVAWRDLRDNPVLGIGVSDFGRQLHEAPRTSGAHSSYLTVAAELGLPGLILLISGLALTLMRVGRSVAVFPGGIQRSTLIGMLVTYVGFAAASFFYDLWWDDFHWVFLGLLLGLTVDGEALRRRRGVSVS
jgi:hypothetical protein